MGIYTDPKHVILYTSNGEARQEFSIVLTGPPQRGAHAEQRDQPGRWVPRDGAGEYQMDRSMRLRVGHY